MPNWIESDECKKAAAAGGTAMCVFCRKRNDWRQIKEAAGLGNPRDTICPLGFKLGEMPSIPKPKAQEAKQNQTQASFRPGDIFASLIHKITGQVPCARCNDRRQQMNKLGWIGCLKNHNMIVGWIVDEAKRRNIEVDSVTVLGLLKTAFREARKKRSKPVQ